MLSLELLEQTVEKGGSCPRHCDRERSVAGSNPDFLPLFCFRFFAAFTDSGGILSGLPRRSAPRNDSLSVFQQPAETFPAKTEPPETLYLFVFYAIPDAKPVPTFAGIALAPFGNGSRGAFGSDFRTRRMIRTRRMTRFAGFAAKPKHHTPKHHT